MKNWEGFWEWICKESEEALIIRPYGSNQTVGDWLHKARTHWELHEQEDS